MLCCACSAISHSLQPHRRAGSSVHRIFLGRNTGVGCYFLLQGVFLTKGSNPHLLHWQADFLPLSDLGSPRGILLITQSCLTLCDPKDCSPPGSSVHGILQARIQEWGAISSSRRSSPPRDQIPVSCLAGLYL